MFGRFLSFSFWPNIYLKEKRDQREDEDNIFLLKKNEKLRCDQNFLLFFSLWSHLINFSLFFFKNWKMLWKLIFYKEIVCKITIASLFFFYYGDRNQTISY